MTKDQLRSEILKEIENLSEESLKAVLTYVINIQKKEKLNELVARTIKEHHGLLKRLADS